MRSTSAVLSATCTLPGIQRTACASELVVPGRVVVAGVEQGDASVERCMNCRDALGFVRRAVQVGHPHAPETERKDARAVGSELGRLRGAHGLTVDRNSSIGKKAEPDHRLASE
jgi:ribosomal protein L34E